MPFGFEHGDGWFDLVWRLFERLEPLVVAAEEKTEQPFQILQMKQKFGSLRVRSSFMNDEISALIDGAELESMRTCDVCGKPGTRRGGGWIETRCDEHAWANRTQGKTQYP